MLPRFHLQYLCTENVCFQMIDNICISLRQHAGCIKLFQAIVICDHIIAKGIRMSHSLLAIRDPAVNGDLQ